MAQIAPASKSADLDAEPSALAGLLARVEAAEGPNFELERAIHEVFRPRTSGDECFPDGTLIPDGWGGDLLPPAYTASLDAALALCERVLPGCWWSVGRDGGDGCIAKLNRGSDVVATGLTPALALLAAMLKALIAQAAGPEGGQSSRLDEPLLSKGGGESSSREPSPSIRGVVRG